MYVRWTCESVTGKLWKLLCQGLHRASFRQGTRRAVCLFINISRNEKVYPCRLMQKYKTAHFDWTEHKQPVLTNWDIKTTHPDQSGHRIAHSDQLGHALVNIPPWPGRQGRWRRVVSARPAWWSSRSLPPVLGQSSRRTSRLGSSTGHCENQADSYSSGSDHQLQHSHHS